MIAAARLTLLVILGFAALPVGRETPSEGQDGQTSGATSTGATTGQTGRAPSADLVLPPNAEPIDSARAELAIGRAWHAARILRTAHPNGAGLDTNGRLLFGRAEALSKNWAGVISVLEPIFTLGGPGPAGQRPVTGLGANNGEGFLLLARAYDATSRFDEAAGAYQLAIDAANAGGDRSAALASSARRIRMVVARAARGDSIQRAGDWRDALQLERQIDSANVVLADWSALEVARTASDAKRLAELRTVLALVADTAIRNRAWDLEPKLLLAMGDSTAARTVLTGLTTSLTGSRQGEAWLILGNVLRARRDSTGARNAYTRALATASAGSQALAARNLLEMGGITSSATALSLARALQATDATRSLRAYDLHVSLLGSAAPSSQTRLARATLMAGVVARHAAAAEEFRVLSESSDSTVAPAALDQWARLRDRQNRPADAITLRDRLVQRFPRSTQTADMLFLRADSAHDRNQLDVALAGYKRLVELAPAQDRAGLARMRWGQIHVLRSEWKEAAEVFHGYVVAFPRGSRFVEAAYWAARAHLALGEQAPARDLIAQLKQREPFGYYSVVASEALQEPFTVDVPAGEPTATPDWLTSGLATLDLLEAAGLTEGVTATIAALRARADQAAAGAFTTPGEQADGLLLAEALITRKHFLDGINVGLAVQSGGMAWNRRLLQVVFPFPNPERVLREANEWGADPWLIAGVIRQESAWEEGIRSVANAIGLMQVIPPTGRELFQKLGMGTFTEEMLTVGDANMHAGTNYLVGLLATWNGNLPLALSAYNAGPARATRWRTFPEFGDDLRFTERIPFAETRDYVKRIYRNRVLYRAMYGGG